MHNVSDILSKQALKQPSEKALLTNQSSISYLELDILVKRCATYLKQQGIKENDVVIHIFSNPILSIIAMFASARIGATMVSSPSNFSNDYLKELSEESLAKVLITDAEDTKELQINTLVVKQKLFENTQIETANYVEKPNAPWQLIIGSGSTGKNKLFAITHSHEINRTLLWTPILADDIVTSFSEVTYSSVKRRILETFHAGASFFIFSANKRIQDLRIHNVTLLQTTAFHIEQLLADSSLENSKAISSLRAIILGASTISRSLRQRIKERFTSNLFVRYGSNESGTISYTSLDKVFSKTATVGRPLKGVVVEIVDDDDRSMPVGKPGLIRIKSKGIVDTYINDDIASQKSFKNGWFYPGDIGLFKEDGQLIHLGRHDDMMIMNGINIYPSHIESVMLEHPDLLEAKAITLKSDIHQDIPICCIVKKQDSALCEKSLEEYALKKMGAYRPQKILLFNQIPKTNNGKLIKSELINMIKKRMSPKRSD